jgi:signal transduction histidine kinase
MADPVLLHQILLNLIDNALTYRCPDRTPQITISTVSEGDTVTLTVADNGIGIPPRIQEKMFEVFARGHTNAEYPGTGIGLATVRKAARRMGSDVTVESTVGVGTRFSLRLPIAQNGARHGG